MRPISLLFLLSVTSSLDCSRADHAPRKALVPSDRSAPLGPRIEAVASVDAATATTAEADAPAADPSVSPLPIVDGTTLLQKIRDSGHKGVVVNAWASWCDPCREELPMLARVAPQLAAKGVALWLVSVDDPDGFPAAKALLDSLHIALPAFAAAPPLQDFKTALNPRWPGMIPVSFLFDGSGKLRYFWPGEVYEKELLPVVDGFVAGKHIDGTAKFGLAPGATQGPGHE